MIKGKQQNNGLDEKLLSSYEVGVLRCAKKSDGDLLRQDGLVKNKVRQVLGLTFKPVMEDGTEAAEVDLLTLIVISSLADAVKKPNVGKLKDIAAVMGELKETNSEVNISVVDKSLEELAMGDIKPNGDIGG